MSNINTFLKQYQIEKGCQVISHTSLKGGSYYIPADIEEDEFIPLYCKALEDGLDLHITEKHRDISPILIDLDFRQTTDTRLYNDNHIVKFLTLLKQHITEYIDVSNDLLTFYVLKKLEPRKNKNNGYKDGLHIMCPHITTKSDIQYIIRNKVLNGMKDIFQNIFTNSYEDMYDEAVIERNNWFLYGSRKPDEEHPWVVSKIYNADIQEIDNIHTDEELVKLLSIRNKFDEVKIKVDKVDEVKQFATLRKEAKEKPKENVARNTMSIPSNLETIHKLVMMLKLDRADSYHDWIDVGMCLKNIDSVHGLNLWIEFSKQSNKYKEGCCDKLWKSFEVRKKEKGELAITEGSLRLWAKKDNPDEYAKLQSQNIEWLIYQSRFMTDADIAKVAHFMFKEDIVCCYANDKPFWYEFKNHRWRPSPDGIALKLKITNELSKQYNLTAAKYLEKARNIEDENQQTIFNEVAKQLTMIAIKLKMCHFKNSVFNQCKELFYVPLKDFYEKLDENKYLIGFENGVYDLKEGIFRDGLPTDLLTFSTGYDYIKDDDIEFEYIEFVKTFMKSIVPDSVLQFLWNTCSYSLSGRKNMEMFEMWQGVGANGKGALGSLLNLTFGDYCYCPDVSIFTTKKTNSSSANPELAMAKGKRLLIATEPSQDDKFQVGKLKAWTGGDPITARTLFKEPITFEAQFLVIIQMNKRPELSDFDKGIVRRLKMVQFPYEFVPHEPTTENQRQGDATLKKKFEEDIKVRQHFMRLLLENYKLHIMGDRVFETPELVQQFTQEYLDSNNKVGGFLYETCDITHNNNDIVVSKDLFEMFRVSEYYNGNSYDSFKQQLELCGFPSTKHNKRDAYRGKHVCYGLKLKDNYGIIDNDEYEL